MPVAPTEKVTVLPVSAVCERGCAVMTGAELTDKAPAAEVTVPAAFVTETV